MYPLALDDYSDAQLEDELAQRQAARKQGLCDYCKRPLQSEPLCAQPERHNLPPPPPVYPCSICGVEQPAEERGWPCKATEGCPGFVL